MKIIKNIQATHYKPVDFNVDTIYLRNNVKFYKILDRENNEKEEIKNISIEEFNNLDINKLCIYDEEQYTYNEYVVKMNNEKEQENKNLMKNISDMQMEIIMLKMEGK